MKRTIITLSLFVFVTAFTQCITLKQALSQSLSGSTEQSIVISNPGTDPRVAQIIKNIKVARNTNDQSAQIFWENKLKGITKPRVINSTPYNFSVKKEILETGSAAEILNITKVTNSVIVANSISSERINGDIYAAVGIWGGTVNTDTLKVFRSSNNGISFTPVLTFAEGMKITNNGLDVEAVSTGDSSYAFIAMDFTLAGGTINSTVLIR